MKREKRRAKRAKPRKSAGPVGIEDPKGSVGRRDVLRIVRGWGLVAVAAGAGGWYLVNEVSATIQEQDLSRIGNGIPAIVQIHDPQCPRCVALQREARNALSDFDDDELQFLVANIRSAEGRELASAHGVGHVTLLFFDADGQRRQTLVGPNTSEALQRAFRRHVARHGAS